MKKFCLPLFIIMTMLSNNAWGGGCQPSTVGQKSRDDFLSIDGVIGMYQCNVPEDDDYDSTDCDNGQIVISLAGGAIGGIAHSYPSPWGNISFDIEGQIVSKGFAYFKCSATTAGGDDKWTANQLVDCTASAANLGLKNVTDGSVEAYITTATKVGQPVSSSGMSGGYTVVSGGGNPCIAYKCKGNKILNSDRTACIENTDKNNCESSGGQWQDGSSKCDCTGNSDLEPDGDKKCKCINKGGQSYTWLNGQCRTTKGNLTYGEEQTANANWQKQQTANKKDCEASGGTYSNSKCSCTAENTSPQGGVCACVSGYKWKNESNKKDGCEPTDKTLVEQACKAAANNGQAQWNPYPSPGKCICKENGYVLDVNAMECKPNEQRAICQPLMNANKARWDTVTGKCVCSQAGYELVGNECVETEEAATARKDKEMKSAKNKIEDVHSKLKRVQDGFKVSAWKNEEGKFNTARLASDSIAGVVLGTTGALVTSKVVKKNQVENGFEDIQCTIGGQTVAQWGDDFSVGTQF